MTPLHCAAESGDVGAVHLLVKAGADVNAADANGNTPLIYGASAFQADEIVRQLLQAGADPEWKNKSGLRAVDCLRADLENEALPAGTSASQAQHVSSTEIEGEPGGRSSEEVQYEELLLELSQERRRARLRALALLGSPSSGRARKSCR